MSKQPVNTEIDLSFRPESYFWPIGLETHLLATIKGAERKAALRRLIEERRIDDIPDFLAKSALSVAERRAIGRIHPAFMGGEYLPDLAPSEVEIARIVIASTTQDVTSVFARRDNDCISYRVVDEYGGDTLSGENTLTSKVPLTLGELETFFNGIWSILEVLEMNFGGSGCDVDKLLGFVLSVESEFYPTIGMLYTDRIEAWAAEQQVEREQRDLSGG